jgi:acetoacetyl-CoA synthetase
MLGSVIPDVLWRPEPDHRGPLTRFTDWVREHKGVVADDYAALHEWSVTDLEGFWSAVVEYLDVRFHSSPTAVLGSRDMPGTQWFPGATLNYAEHALTPGGDADVAVIYAREDGVERTVTRGELRELVGRARAGLVALGVARGDRVVALAPNSVETLVAFLAAASLGAIWSSCSPDFGARAVHDRFAQIEPVVLLAVDGYAYGGKRYDIRPTIVALREKLPTLRATVVVGEPVEGTTSWETFTEERGELTYEPVPFDHPLWVLYSSGTTGLPKGIVHGHGGIVLEHKKSLALQMEVTPADRFFWFTTTGWMMWNFLIGGLLVGAPIVMFDGNPGHPDLGTLWRLAEKHRITVFGTSAPFLQACLKAGLRPGDENDLSAIRAIGSTGAPLSEDGFRWVGDAVGGGIQIGSMSGGTDVCTGFVGSAPNVPVWLGEISCASLGVRVVAYDEEGKEVVDEVGELVITNPMPSMPVMFWNDPDGSRLRAAYFEDYPGVWRHGDWVRVTPRGSYIIYGRSDSTLNRGGVRMGTADFYAVVEGFAEVADSLVIDTTELGARDEGALLCFLVLADDASLEDVEPGLRKALRSELSPRHVPDRFVVVEAIPRTLNGKKCEVPVKKILAGVAPEKAVSRGALLNPDALAPFLDLAARGV